MDQRLNSDFGPLGLWTFLLVSYYLTTPNQAFRYCPSGNSANTG